LDEEKAFGLGAGFVSLGPLEGLDLDPVGHVTLDYANGVETDDDFGVPVKSVESGSESAVEQHPYDDSIELAEHWHGVSSVIFCLEKAHMGWGFCFSFR
jgi:hypothetical protein